MVVLKRCCDKNPRVQVYFCPQSPDHITGICEITIYCSGHCKRSLKIIKSDITNVSIEIDKYFKKWNDSFIQCSDHLDRLEGGVDGRIKDGCLYFYCDKCFTHVSFNIDAKEMLSHK